MAKDPIEEQEWWYVNLFAKDDASIFVRICATGDNKEGAIENAIKLAHDTYPEVQSWAAKKVVSPKDIWY